MADAKPTNGETIEVTDSLERKIVLKTLGPADMLNLFEAAGANSGNAAWMRFAMELASVRSVDGVPLPFAIKKEQLLMAAERLGNEGMMAVHLKLFPPEEEGADESAPTAEAQEVEAAKN